MTDSKSAVKTIQDMAATSYTWKFTNNTTQALIMTLMTPGLSGGTEVGAENSDKTAVQLIPAEYSDGKIPAGQTATYTLDWNITFKNGKVFPCCLYPLFAITADKLIPVWTKSIFLDFSASPVGFDAESVDQPTVVAFIQAMSFMQQYEAYPKSKFAKGFNAALATANAPATASGGTASSNNDAIKTAVNNFFKNSKSAKDVTLDIYLAVKGYFNRYPFPWAMNNSQTYYLYSSEQAVSSNTGSFVGTVVVNKPANYSYSASAAGYTMSFAKANKPDYLNPKNKGGDQNNWTTASSTTTLGYAAGQFIDTPNEDVHDICVQGLYSLESTLTGQSNTDTPAGTIVPILVGTVLGKTVIGYPKPIKGTYDKAKSGESDPYLYNLLHPKGVGGVIQSIMEIGGIVMFLDFAWGKLKSRKETNDKDTAEAKATGGKDAEAKFTQEDLDKAKAEAKQETQEEFEKNAKSEGISTEAQTSISEAGNEAIESGDASALDSSVGGALDAAQAAGKYGELVEKCQTTAEKIGDAATECELAAEGGSEVAAEQMQKLGESASEVSSSYDNLTKAVEKIEADSSLGDAGSKIGEEVDASVTQIESTVSSVDTTLEEVQTALADDPSTSSIADTVKEAESLNKEVTETVDNQKQAAEDTDKVNSGEEDPATDKESLPETVEV